MPTTIEIWTSKSFCFVSSLLTEMKCWMPWPHRLHFEVARLKKHRAWEVSDLLLLLLYCHIPPSRGMEIRTLEIVKEQELDNPFFTGQFQDHNILSSWNLQGWWPSTSSCTKTRHFTGHKQIDLQVGRVIAGLNLSQKFDISLTGILLHLQLNFSFPGGQRVVSSDPSMSAGVLTRLFCHRFARFPGAVATSYTILLCHVARMMCQLALRTGPLVSHPLYPLPSLPSSHIAQILTA